MRKSITTKKIQKFIKEHYKLNSRVYIKESKTGRSIKLVVYNKQLAENLINIGISTNKTFLTKIPKVFMATGKKVNLLLEEYLKQMDHSIFQNQREMCTHLPKDRD